MAQPGADVVMDLLEQVDAERLLRATMSLVEIPSPSGEERAVAERYAEILSDNGLSVSLDHEFPDSPTVIARLPGAGQGGTLQLEGHTDTVSQPHPPPTVRDGRIYGRGAADMKAGLAAMAEAVRVLHASSRSLRGDVLLTAHGQHEDPVAPHELHAPLFALFRKGVVGDAAIIAEGPSHEMVLAGKGLCVFELSLERDGEPVHEIPWRDEVPNPILGGQRVLELLAERDREWRSRPDPLLGPETFFVGVFEAGDYFNRIPTRCRLVGSRRYPPERSYDEVVNDLRALATQVESETGLRAVLETRPSGQGFRVAPGEPIVQAVSRAYQQVVGRDLPRAGMSLIANGSQFNTIAHVPTVYHGVDQTTAHSGLEHVALADVVRTARVLIASAVEYSGLAL
jgi:acetylornithine deacetylase/succinyl-diaminopimelate desuccinylase-like protein